VTGAGAGACTAGAALALVSQRLTWPTIGSVPKKAFEQLAAPATVFCSHELPAP
jgi:hypothetical protein